MDIFSEEPGCRGGVEKKQGTAITRYIRDASGNVMAVYQADTLSERPIYGSSRLGNLSYASKPGYRTVGHKQYELSNHLGNVLAVVSDRIHMDSVSTWAEVLSRTDYYPFGLEMTGRTESMSYRYGFNGKEKDPSGQWSNQTHYDYGFRIYNPTIGKFLSVDPLTKSYPMLTPYQFASNRPIDGVDLDGLEFQKFSFYTLKLERGLTFLKQPNFIEVVKYRDKKFGFYEPASPAGYDDFCPCIGSNSPDFEYTKSLANSKVEDAAEVSKDTRWITRQPNGQNVDRTTKGKIQKVGTNLEFLRDVIGSISEFFGDNSERYNAMMDKKMFYSAINLTDNYFSLYGIPDWANNQKSILDIKNWVNDGTLPYDIDQINLMNENQRIEAESYNQKVSKLGLEIYKSRRGWGNAGNISVEKNK